MISKSEHVYVVIDPPAKLDAKLIEEVADIINKDISKTRLLLTGIIPKIISYHDNMETAELTAGKLKALNLVVIVCRDSEFSGSSPMYRAHSLKLEGKRILFHNRNGQIKRVDSKDIFLIIAGRLQTYTEIEEVTTKTKFSLSRTMLTGIPMWHEVKDVTKNKSPQTEDFIRLYQGDSLEPFVEILKHDFDYSFLGVTMTSSSTLNFTAMVTKIKNIFSQSIFDDKLMEPLSEDVVSLMSQNADINCKLIYLYHQAIKNPGSLDKVV